MALKRSTTSRTGRTTTVLDLALRASQNFWAHYLMLAVALTSASLASFRGGSWPTMAMLVPLVNEGNSSAIALWQLLYLVGIVTNLLAGLRLPRTATVMRPAGITGELATGAFLLISWCATTWMHRVDSDSWADHALLLPPVAALMLAVQGHLTASWLISIAQRILPKNNEH